MKKITLIILATMLMLTACSASPSADSNIPVNAPATTEQTVQVPTQEQAPTEQELSPKDLAASCIDMPVEELYALIGAPESSEYGPSCLGDGEDGNLYYDGFVVYTYRDSSGEIVQFVE